jgi:hypothetical protein
MANNKIRELEERMARLEKVLLHIAEEITTVLNENVIKEQQEEEEQQENADYRCIKFDCDHNSRSREVYLCEECEDYMCPECSYYYCETCEKWNHPRCIYKRRFGWGDPNEPEEFRNHIEDEEHIITFLCSLECIESTGVSASFSPK